MREQIRYHLLQEWQWWHSHVLARKVLAWVNTTAESVQDLAGQAQGHPTPPKMISRSLLDPRTQIPRNKENRILPSQMLEPEKILVLPVNHVDTAWAKTEDRRAKKDLHYTMGVGVF